VTQSQSTLGLQLNPDVAHPPFAWQVALPDDPSWSVLDTHPSSWQRSAERLVDDRLAGRRVRSAQRREVLDFIADLVAACQRGGTLISLVQLGFLGGGILASTGLHLAWYDSSPDPASIATVRQATSRQGVTEEHDTPAGPILVQRDFASLVAPGGSRVGMTSLQAFLPLPGRTWTAVVATASPHTELTDLLHELVVAVAGSIQAADDEDEDEDQPTDDEPPGPDVAADRYAPVEQPQAPGIERGFKTLRAHRVDPDQPRHDGTL